MPTAAKSPDRTLLGRSPLDALLNLHCENGHRHYSPTPEAFRGGPCQTGQGAGECRRPLKRIRRSVLPRNSGEVAAVNGPTTPEQTGDASG